MIETELWPNFLRIAWKKKIPVMMMNGRISDRSMRRYSFVKHYTKKMLNQIRMLCMQSSFDVEHIIAMGADPKRVIITGNTKFDQTYATVSPEECAALKREFHFEGRGPVIVCGSTHSGEEEILMRTFARLKAEYPDLCVILTPREITRAPGVKAHVGANGFSVIRRSEMGTNADDGRFHQVVILDTIGELGRLYSIADVVFVGGSLVKIGGHNILEPAAHGKPIIVGSYTFNFKEIFELLGRRGVCLMVKNEEELDRTLRGLLANPEKMKEMGEEALRVVHENRGATQRNIECFEKLVDDCHVTIVGRHP